MTTTPSLCTSPPSCPPRRSAAGAEETVGLLGTQLATPQAGALFAAVGCATVSLALLVQRSLFPVRQAGVGWGIDCCTDNI